MRDRKRIVVFLLLLLTFSCVSFAKPTEIIYLIPEGFTGGVIIVFNQQDGITPEKDKDGTIIYRVPKNGLIKVKEPLAKAAYELKYYFVDDKGNKTRIEYLYPRYSGGNPSDPNSRETDKVTEDESNNKVFASDHETTNFNVGGEKVYIHSFIVEKPISALHTFMQTSHRIFDIQRELLKGKTPAIDLQKN